MACPALAVIVEVRGNADRKERCCIVTVAIWEIAELGIQKVDVVLVVPELSRSTTAMTQL